jgi:hypothetical protein
MRVKAPRSEAEARYRAAIMRQSLTRGQSKYSAGGRPISAASHDPEVAKARLAGPPERGLSIPLDNGKTQNGQVKARETEEAG